MIKKLDYIDSLRGIAILMVVMVHVSHFGEFGSENNYFREIVWAGRWGVPLFYIASSFTLMLSMTARSQKEQYPTSNFFIRRFFRIAPLYYLAMVYYLFQDGFGARYWLCDQPSISISNILANISFVHGFYPYWFTSVVPGGWSVAVEFTFYCLLPFVFKFMTSLKQAILFCIITIGIMAIGNRFLLDCSLISCDRLWNEYFSMSILNQMPVFALGIILYFIVTKQNNDLTFRQNYLSIFLLLLTLIVCGWKSIFTTNILYSLFFLVFAIFMSKTKWKLFINPIIQYIGTISYSMYLTHIGVLFWLEKWGIISFIDLSLPNMHVTNYLIRFMITLVSTVVISTLTYRIIEIPFQNLGRDIIKRREHS